MFEFGLLTTQLIQSSAARTWNCVTHIANFVWLKVLHTHEPSMPRSRRRHHSRSRTRSRSHSIDRDREVKRRKVESYDSSQQKRSLSPTSSIDETEPDQAKPVVDSLPEEQRPESDEMDVTAEHDDDDDDDEPSRADTTIAIDSESDASDHESSATVDAERSSPLKKLQAASGKTASPKQLAKLQRREEREREREARNRKKQAESERKAQQKLERERQREERKQQKLREIEEKQREKEMKEEVRRKEKEMREEQKRREREAKVKEKEEREEQRRRKEQEEKQKVLEQKQVLERKKQKAAAVFANFFTKKSSEAVQTVEEPKVVESSNFMPFAVKSDMRLAPIQRRILSVEEKTNVVDAIEQPQSPTVLYLDELKVPGRTIGRSGKTWPLDEDVTIVEEANPGEDIIEEKPGVRRVRAKLLKFAENRRPAYFGTWRKRSALISARQPHAKDTQWLDYEVDSEEEWEEEGPGESLHGSDDDDDEDKENDEDNDYEVDNEFFVPHGHLSDDEVNDDEDNERADATPISPESHKAKLKLLKRVFDAEMRSRTEKLKPRVIGCIWSKRTHNDADEVEATVRKLLAPFAIMCNSTAIKLRKRSEWMVGAQTTVRRTPGKVRKELNREMVPDFLKLIHGSVKGKSHLINEFYASRQLVEVMSKNDLRKEFRKFATWMKCEEEGPLYKRFCWHVLDDVRNEFNLSDLCIVRK